jgi:rare lipoprotein A
VALVPKGRTLVLIGLLAVLLVLVLQVTARAEPVLASYYGEWFTGKPTASGELYDPNSYTAAHPYLPFGTRLLVSYNGRSAIVTVNDRMPSGSERNLDLSLAAAQYIGLTSVGEAVVDAEVLQTQPTPPA